MIIREGEKVPFWYGIVCIAPEYLGGVEVQPIPFHWVKRWWYNQLHGFKFYKWEEKALRAKRTAYKAGYVDGKKEMENRIINQLDDVLRENMPVIIDRIFDAIKAGRKIEN